MIVSRLKDLWLTSVPALRSGQSGVKKRLESLLSIYEDLIGVSQVKESHAALLQAEQRFVSSQEERRRSQTELNGIQEKVREIRFQLDRTPRGQENYLELITKEIELMREERTSREIFEREEKNERERFTGLSTCLRASYEKERAQSEKTKPLFLIISIFGAMIGATISALSSRTKIKQLKQLIIDTNAASTEASFGQLERLVHSTATAETATMLQHIESLVVGRAQPQPQSIPITDARDQDKYKWSEFSVDSLTTHACLATIIALILFQLWSR